MDDAHATPPTPDQLAHAADVLAPITAAGGRPVVSRPDGTHIHAVLPGALEHEAAANLPYCRRDDRRSGAHDGWFDATVLELATLQVCGTCRRRIRWLRARADAEDV